MSATLAAAKASSPAGNDCAAAGLQFQIFIELLDEPEPA